MNLEGNASRADGQDRQRGYAMAALLVMMGVMAILMTVALPTWKQTAQREKEEELIWRGTQYARAIGAYQRKFANSSPPTLDVLIDQHLLRKKYKDPMAVTKDGEFALLYVDNQPGLGRGTGQGTGGQGSGSQGGGSSAGLIASTTPSGNIIGVASKNTGASLRTYNDHTHYNEWQFMALQQTTRAGGAGQGGAQGAGGRGSGQGVGGGGGFGPGGAGGAGGGGRGRGGQGQGQDGRGGQGNPGGRGGQVNPQGGDGGRGR